MANSPIFPAFRHAEGCLIHCTHRRNLTSIEREGINPARARSRFKVSWYALPDQVLYVSAHVMRVWSWELEDLVLLPITDLSFTKKFVWRGIRITRHVKHPVTCVKALDVLKWLATR